MYSKIMLLVLLLLAAALPLLFIAASCFIQKKAVLFRLPASGPLQKPILSKLSGVAMNCMEGTPLDGVPVPSYQDFEQHMKLLFSDPDEEIYLRLIHDADKKRPVKEIRTSLRRLQYDWPEIERYNRAGYGVFVMVNQMPAGAKGNDKDITGIRAVFWEHDAVSKEEQWELARKMPMQPSFCVVSKRSIHFWYLIKEALIEHFRRIQRKLARLNGSDSTLQNPSRILRCAGTLHSKDPERPFLCRLLEVHPERVYTETEFEAMLDEVLPPDSPPPAGDSPAALPEKREYRRGTAEELDILCKECLFIRHCKEHANILGEPDWLAMTTEMAPYEGGVERIHEYSRHYPRYTPEETDAKIQHFRDSGTGPMLCTTIAEKGFVCPKLKDGGCPGVNAPAALPFVLKKTARPWYRETKSGSMILSRGVLAEHLKVRYPALHSSGLFHLYQDGVYLPFSDMEIDRLIYSHLLPEHSRSHDIKDVAYQWSIQIVVPPEDLNPDSNIINVRNGLFHVKEGKLTPHDPSYPSTIQINASYDPEADCPCFKKLITESLGPEYVDFVGAMTGYILSTSVKAEKAFFLVGSAASGKSTLIHLIEYLVGEKNKTSIAWQDLGENFQRVELFGKLLNSNADLPTKALDDAGLFKQLVSGDRISAARKFKSSFEFYPKAKFLFACNEMAVSVSDKSLGFFRRIIILPFDHTVPEDKRDPFLLYKLRCEADGILTFALSKLQELAANDYKFRIPERSKQALRKYMQSCNSAYLFCNEHCRIAPGAEISRLALYNHYKSFAEQYSLKPMSQERFNASVERLYGQEEVFRSRTSGKRRKSWIGLEYDPKGGCESGDFDYALGLTETPLLADALEASQREEEQMRQAPQQVDDLLDF